MTFLCLHRLAGHTKHTFTQILISLRIGVRFSAEAGILSLRHQVQIGSGAHPAFYLLGTGATLQGVKRPGREADHSPPYGAGDEKSWRYASTLPYVLTAWCLVKHGILVHGVVLGQA
jgi:hypothetical protein